MSIMMISDVAGQTADGYDRLLAVVGEALTKAQGFVVHASYPMEGGWRVVEIWESRDDAGRFFAEHIAPHLPDGIRPRLTFEPLHDLVASSADATG
jgi:hypothetical protein